MPTNLYGINDNFHPENSHVIPALMQRFHQAKINNDAEVVVWGTGSAMREFLYVDDMAIASLFVLELDEQTYKANTQPILSHINIGTGKDITIREMAEVMQRVVEYEGKLTFDAAKPDGAPRKLIDVARLSNMGWKYNIDLEDGLEKTYNWYLNAHKQLKINIFTTLGSSLKVAQKAILAIAVLNDYRIPIRDDQYRCSTTVIKDIYKLLVMFGINPLQTVKAFKGIPIYYKNRKLLRQADLMEALDELRLSLQDNLRVNNSLVKF